MNYGEIERKTFRTFLAFAAILITLNLLFFMINSNIYRIKNIVYDESSKLSIQSLEDLRGTSIWLVDDTYFDTFYIENPEVERISIKKELPDTILVDIFKSDKLAYIQDNRRTPPKRYILHKNLYTLESKSKEGLLIVNIDNGPVKEGFFEEIVTLAMTLKKYPINLANLEINYDGQTMIAIHFGSHFYLGSAYDLGRKAAVIGFYISEEPCEGEVRLVYSEDGSTINAITNCN